LIDHRAKLRFANDQSDLLAEHAAYLAWRACRGRAEERQFCETVGSTTICKAYDEPYCEPHM